MKLVDGWADAAARKDRKVFSAKGHPQWRKKVRIVGLLSGLGSWSFDVDGALAPMDGVGEVERWEGNIHDAASCWKVMMNVKTRRCYGAKDLEGLCREWGRERVKCLLCGVERGS